MRVNPIANSRPPTARILRQPDAAVGFQELVSPYTNFCYPSQTMRTLFLVLCVIAFTARADAQAPSPPAADTSFYGVSYVEVMASARQTAVTALRRYRQASQAIAGCMRIDIFEQIGRPGHFAIIETWRDQSAFDARPTAAFTQLTDAIAAARVSDYDQRPYKTLSAGRTAEESAGAVTVITHVDVAPNPAVAPMLRALADASRMEPGNLRFDVYAHTMRGNHFTVFETWRDQAALDAHVAAAHTRKYRDDLHPLTGSPLDERVFTRVR
jgi:quinol monooxygenase YgiN